MCLNYLNMALFWPQLGRHAEASKSVDSAIFYATHGNNSGGVEDILPQEISLGAVLKTNVVFRQALYYFKPVMDA